MGDYMEDTQLEEWIAGIENRFAGGEQRVAELSASLTTLNGHVEAELTKATDQWALAQFAEKESDLRWAKEQAANVARDSAVLSMAILAASTLVTVGRLWFIIIVLLPAAFAVYWEYQLHDFARQTRIDVNNLLKPINKGVDEKKLDHHVLLLYVLIAVIAGAAFVAMFAPLKPRI
jgi:hypothetical protein